MVFYVLELMHISGYVLLLSFCLQYFFIICVREPVFITMNFFLCWIEIIVIAIGGGNIRYQHNLEKIFLWICVNWFIFSRFDFFG